MKKAIVTGSTGLLGRTVVKYLISKNIDVLCVGRKKLSTANMLEIFKSKVDYIQLPMERIGDLNNKIINYNWSIGSDCVFYNFAWGGKGSLTNGSFQDQLDNSIYSAEAVKIAKEMGCIKFINCGTLEETFAEQHLQKKINTPFISTQTNYAIAKLASRDMCKIFSYLNKIDYIHTRLSLPLPQNLNSKSYVSKTLKNIFLGKKFDVPKNNRLFDVIFFDDVAEAYYLIGLHGKNKKDYFIGTSKPITLNEYFNIIKKISARNKVKKIPKLKNKASSFFSINELQRDTGFKPKTNCFNFDLIDRNKL